MRSSDLTIALITDEVSPLLDEGLAFARLEGLSTVDLRVVDGRNVLVLSRSELEDVARRVRAAGLKVSCLCTPLLKWNAPGQHSDIKGDQFGFDIGDRPPRLIYDQAFEAAEILGARHLRIFSYLAYEGYRVEDLRQPLDELLELADRHDMKLHVENEGVCNAAGLGHLYDLVTHFDHPRLRALPDIMNAYRAGHPASEDELARLLPFTDILHVKDYSNAAQRTVPVGEGDISFEKLVAATLTEHSKPLTLSIETHAQADLADQTRRSIAGLRRIIRTLGLP
ncbi:MAG TPA: TIM barrel protein [Hyphomicrobiaceae bacterium]|nr:TIM barrel protein [Hyphomicrobiaceae bacterium]